ncbi:hypothetical protein AX16_008650 [Volvariella volvacea WC 439]|nr:hypothetical protein AX16_008650 [Volvariella volvacea WC 439]
MPPTLTKPQSFTVYGWSLCLWILITTFQYGYHISALNQIQAVLTCKESRNPQDPVIATRYGLPLCVPMSDFLFSVVTAVFTIGGLIGSLSANVLMEGNGRKGAIKASSAFMALGAGIMGVGPSVSVLAFGRLLIGIGSGIGLCVVPIFLSEIAPAKISGNVGVLTQLGIVLGIMITQIIGFRLATPEDWRMVLFLSCALAIAQLVLSTKATESPTWLNSKRRLEEQKQAIDRLYHLLPSASRDDLEDPLLAESETLHHEGRPAPPTFELLTSREIQRPLAIVCLAMTAQQISGVNAVLYYSNDILSKSLPDFAPYVSLGITVVNVLMTFPPIILIEKMGRKKLLFLSIGGVCLSLLAIGHSLNAGLIVPSSVAIITFIMSFAVGLGPVPFVMIPEVSPAHVWHAFRPLSSVFQCYSGVFFTGRVIAIFHSIITQL